MKVLLDSKYLMDMDTLNKIQEVTQGGSYNNYVYTVTGEPANVDLIKDSQLVCAEEHAEVKEQDTQKKLDDAQKELSKLRLEKCRDKAYDRIIEEDPRVQGKKLREFMSSSEYSWTIDKWNLGDYTKWKYDQEKKNENN